MLHCWSSVITKYRNIDSKRAAITLHVTGPDANCTSKKNGPIFKHAVIPHKADFRRMQWNKVGICLFQTNIWDLFALAVMNVDTLF